jgi:cation diffusion facilitator family transporter
MRVVPSTPSTRVIQAALVGNLLVALTKFVAAGWTGSSAMLSEGVHSIVDMLNGVLLLYGLKRSALPPDEEHPLGHGRELYFWSFVVALFIFTLGAGISIYEGILHILDPTMIVSPAVNFTVLAFAFVFEFGPWWMALREFRRIKGGLGYFEAVKQSKDPTSFLILFEDSAALLGILMAFAGLSAATHFGLPVFDGAASIGIGLVLGSSALVIARESKGLLIGEPAHSPINTSIRQIASRQTGIERVNGLSTVHLAPQQIVATLSLEFADDLRTPEIEAAVVDLERNIRASHPEVIALFVKPQTATGYSKRPTASLPDQAAE